MSSGTRGAVPPTARGSRSGRSARWSGRGPASSRRTTRRRRAARSPRPSRRMSPKRTSGAGSSRPSSRSSGSGRAPPTRSSSSAPGGRSSSDSQPAAPVVMVFEDLHHADPGLLDFIDHLLEWSRGVPIYVLTLARPELLERRPDWGAGRRNFASLHLEPLPEPAMRELLGGLVPGLPEAAVRTIVERADGVPLYAVETVRMLLADGKLVASDGVYRPAGDLATIAVPETLTELVAARLDALERSRPGPPPRRRRPRPELHDDGPGRGERDRRAGSRAAPAGPRPARAPRGRGQPAQPRAGPVRLRPGAGPRGRLQHAREARPHGRHLAAARYFESLGTDELAAALAGHYLAAYRNAPEGPEADALAAQARDRPAGGCRAGCGPGLARAGRRVPRAGARRDDRPAGAGPPPRAVPAVRRPSRPTTTRRSATSCGRPRSSAGSATARRPPARSRSSVAALIDGSRSDRALALLEPAAAEFADLVGDPGAVALDSQLARALIVGEQPQRAVEVADRALAAAERGDLVAIVADTLVTRGSALCISAAPTKASARSGRGSTWPRRMASRRSPARACTT